MGMKIKFTPFNYQMPSHLQETLKVESRQIKIKAVLPISAAIKKNHIFYCGRDSVSHDELLVYLERPELIQLVDESEKEIKKDTVKILMQNKDFLNHVYSELNMSVNNGDYDDQILMQKSDSAKLKAIEDDLAKGTVRASPNNILNSTKPNFQSLNDSDENSMKNLVYGIIRDCGDDITVGEITETFNRLYVTDAEDIMPRNEIAKLVTSLKTDRLIQPVNRRNCSFANRDVLSWTTNLSITPTQEVISLAKKKVEDSLLRYQQAVSDYEALLRQLNPEDDIV
jgi:hypothetical protein